MSSPADLSSSFWTAVEVSEVRRTGGTATAETVQQTRQDADHGPGVQTCSIWMNDYRMTLVEGQWLIDRTDLRVPPSAC